MLVSKGLHMYTEEEPIKKRKKYSCDELVCENKVCDTSRLTSSYQTRKVARKFKSQLRNNHHKFELMTDPGNLPSNTVGNTSIATVTKGIIGMLKM